MSWKIVKQSLSNILNQSSAQNLDVPKALERRHSTRAFLDKPVSKDTIQHILKAASFSPSGANLQPWQVAVVMNDNKAALSDAIIQAYDRGEMPQPEQSYYPQNWYEPYKTRRFETGLALYKALGIERKDKQRRTTQWKANYLFFGAPVGLLFLMDRQLGNGALVDMGIFLQSVMLSAVAYGLDTCPQAALTDYPKIIRQQLELPDNLMIVCGMALGYADQSHPVNHYRTKREPVNSFTRWYG